MVGGHGPRENLPPGIVSLLFSTCKRGNEWYPVGSTRLSVTRMTAMMMLMLMMTCVRRCYCLLTRGVRELCWLVELGLARLLLLSNLLSWAALVKDEIHSSQRLQVRNDTVRWWLNWCWFREAECSKHHHCHLTSTFFHALNLLDNYWIDFCNCVAVLKKTLK